MAQPVGSGLFSTLPVELVALTLSHASDERLRLVCKSWNGQTSVVLEQVWERLKTDAAPSPSNMQGRMQIIEELMPAPHAQNYFLLFKAFVRDVDTFYGKTVKIPFNEMQCTQLQHQLRPVEKQIQGEMDKALKALWSWVKPLEPTGLPEDEDMEGILHWLNAEENRPYLQEIKSFAAIGCEQLSSEIGKLVGLEELCMTDCNVRELPVEMRSLTSLKTLQFVRSYDPLFVYFRTTGRGFSKSSNLSLPSRLQELISLQSLYVNDNQLGVLPSWISKLSALQTLNISDNRISELPAELEDLPSLQTLVLNGNPLMFIPNNILESKRSVFASNLQIQEFKEARDFPCSAPLAKLYQAIMRRATGEEIKEIFAAVESKDKTPVFSEIYAGSEEFSPLERPREWEEEHILDDRNRFCHVVRGVILQKYERLSWEPREQVREAIYGHISNRLASRTHEMDYFAQNIPRLAQAMDDAEKTQHKT